MFLYMYLIVGVRVCVYWVGWMGGGGFEQSTKAGLIDRQMLNTSVWFTPWQRAEDSFLSNGLYKAFVHGFHLSPRQLKYIGIPGEGLLLGVVMCSTISVRCELMYWLEDQCLSFTSSWLSQHLCTQAWSSLGFRLAVYQGWQCTLPVMCSGLCGLLSMLCSW